MRKLIFLILSILCCVSKIVSYEIIKRLVSWNSNSTALIKDESGDIQKWQHSQLMTFTTDNIHNWRHSGMTAHMISISGLKAFIYMLASLTHYSNSARAIDWRIIAKLTQETCVFLSFFDTDHTTDGFTSLSKIHWADGCAASSHASLTITTCFSISLLNHRHSMSLLRMCLLGTVRKQFSSWLSKQTKALLHILQRDLFISQISIRLLWHSDRSFDCHDMSIEIWIEICWRMRISVVELEIILCLRTRL